LAGGCTYDTLQSTVFLLFSDAENDRRILDPSFSIQIGAKKKAGKLQPSTFHVPSGGKKGGKGRIII
jgi:hypothetical protein